MEDDAPAPPRLSTRQKRIARAIARAKNPDYVSDEEADAAPAAGSAAAAPTRAGAAAGAGVGAGAAASAADDDMEKPSFPALSAKEMAVRADGAVLRRCRRVVLTLDAEVSCACGPACSPLCSSCDSCTPSQAVP
jgi:hypothetical protein